MPDRIRAEHEARFRAMQNELEAGKAREEELLQRLAKNAQRPVDAKSTAGRTKASHRSSNPSSEVDPKFAKIVAQVRKGSVSTTEVTQLIIDAASADASNSEIWLAEERMEKELARIPAKTAHTEIQTIAKRLLGQAVRSIGKKSQPRKVAFVLPERDTRRKDTGAGEATQTAVHRPVVVEKPRSRLEAAKKSTTHLTRPRR